jgi:hypothetical protein
MSVPSSILGPNIRQCFLLSVSLNAPRINKGYISNNNKYNSNNSLFLYVLISAVRGQVADTTNVKYQHQQTYEHKQTRKS